MLYKAYKEDIGKWTPTWQFMGEVFISEMNQWELMTYKTPTRLTDIFQRNPGLLERRIVIGKSGSKYYEYRFAIGTTPEKIREVSLFEFYKKIRQTTETKVKVDPQQYKFDMFVSELKS